MPPATHLGGRVPRRVDAATKSALLELLEKAVEQGWSVSAWSQARDPVRVADDLTAAVGNVVGSRGDVVLLNSPGDLRE